MKKMILKITGTVILTCLMGCVDGRDFDELNSSCTTDLAANITFEELDSLVQDDVIQIQEDLIFLVRSDPAQQLDHPAILAII